MSLADLVAAGAPELPAGFFYRVTEEAFFGPTVQIRERRRFGSRYCALARVREGQFDTAEEAVVDACTRARQAMDEEALAWQKARDVAVLYGDHDPRRTK